MTMREILIVAVLAVAAVSSVSAQEDVEAMDEAFTIFLDLENYHVGKDGSHEFLTSDHIGEHDNVIVHMSEDEMRMHMAHHDTHDCEHPAAQHEIVSFIQEAMWERPAAPAQPNFIDDAINANYVQSGIGAWDAQPQMGGMPSMAAGPFGGMPVGQMNPMGNLFGNLAPVVPAPAAQAKPASKPASKSPAAPAAAAPKQTAAAADEAKKATPKEVDEDEEAAVARFRDAYHTHKFTEKEATAKALASGKKEPAAADTKAAAAVDEAKKAASLFDTLFDADDKAAMGLFGGDRTDLPENAFDVKDFGMGNVLDKIVDEALSAKPAVEPSDVLTLDPDSSVDEEKKDEHHHKKHHKHHNKMAAKEDGEEQEQQEAEAPAAASSKEDVDLSKLSSDEQQTLKALMKKLGGEASTNTEAPKAEAKKEEANDEVKATKEEETSKAEEVAAQKESSKAVDETPAVEKKADDTAVEEVKVESKKEEAAPDAKKSDLKVDTLQKGIIEEEEEQAVRLAPTDTIKSNELMTTELSHISAAPKAKDFIPESVYSQQAVSFDEKPQLMQKHVPKRILIPRMEEPGPVIGGGSRPVHIMLPPVDNNSPKVGSSRPAPPVQAQIRAAFPPSAITNTAASAAAGGADSPSSNKVTTLATANDEALSAAEVIIF